MPSVLPPVLLRIAVGVVLVYSLGYPAVWSEALAPNPRVVTWRWHKLFPTQLTGIDLSGEGHTVAVTVTPLSSDQANRLYVYDMTGREIWTTARQARMLGVSVSTDGQYLAVGLMDFTVALFSKVGELLWERKSVGVPHLTAKADLLIAFNSGITGHSNLLFEGFRRDGARAWGLHRRGRVWRALVSDRNDLLLSLWNGEVLLIDQRQRLVWQQMFVEDVAAVAISPDDARYFAVGTGVLEPGLHLFERTGRILWQRNVPHGVTEVSLAKEGAFLLSYGNTIRGQQLALYDRSGALHWTYHVGEPATESSTAVIVPEAPLVVAGIERDQQHYLQGFALSGEFLWTAPIPEPIFDFRVSRDGRYIAAATDHGVYFFDTDAVAGPEAHLHR